MTLLDDLLAFDPNALSWLDVIDLHEQAGMTIEELGESIAATNFADLVTDPTVMRLAGVALWLTGPRIDGQRPTLRSFLGDLTLGMLIEATAPAPNRAGRRKGKKHKTNG